MAARLGVSGSKISRMETGVSGLRVEDKASRIQNFEPLLVPGLLQTAEYSRAILHSIDETLSEAELEYLVMTRMARQIVLSRSSAPQLLAVIDETALRRQAGDRGVMKRQLQHLLAVAEATNIAVRVVPLDGCAYVGMYGAFLLLEFQGDPDLVFIENYCTELFLEEDQDLASYRMVLKNILKVCLAPDATMELIGSIAGEI